MEYELIYDGCSLPMLSVGKGIFRVQILVGGQWMTFTSEDEYHEFVDALRRGEP